MFVVQHFEGYDAEGFSMWLCDYKYNDENTINYVVMNKVGACHLLLPAYSTLTPRCIPKVICHGLLYANRHPPEAAASIIIQSMLEYVFESGEWSAIAE